MGYTVKDGELILTNGVFIRRMELPEVSNRYLLNEYRLIKGEFDYFDENGGRTMKAAVLVEKGKFELSL